MTRWTTIPPAKSAARKPQERAGKRGKGAKVSAHIPTEHEEQAALIDWFDNYARLKGLDPRLLCASGNAAKRSFGLAVRLKREGLRAGYPDLFLAIPTIYWDNHGLWIEMKRKNWKPPTSGDALKHHQRQLEIMDILFDQGYQFAICCGADEAMQRIKEYLEG